MQTKAEDSISVLFADKEQLRHMVEEQYARLNLEYDPDATAEEARELILQDGVRPEDNLFSCGIIQAREEK